MPGDRGRVLPVWKISRIYDIPVKRVSDINQPAVVKLLEDLKPDIIVSAYFNQIIKEPIIELPRLGILNIHPGWLPAYRGAMAYFWVLKNGSETAGVSVHWIDKGTDTGEIVARRQIKIEKGMTQQKVLILTAVTGSILLQRIAKLILTGQKPNGISVKDEQSQYYSVPGEKEFNEYFNQQRFFRIRDVISFLLRRKNKIQ
ncbi:MAG: methionyl-tRNA formyltransferase [Gammaproteobacteria bacterium]